MGGGMRANNETSRSSARAGAATTMSKLTGGKILLNENLIISLLYYTWISFTLNSTIRLYCKYFFSFLAPF